MFARAPRRREPWGRIRAAIGVAALLGGIGLIAPMNSVVQATPGWQAVAITPDNLDRLRPVARWGSPNGKALAYAPDRQTAALGTEWGVTIFETGTWRKVRSIETPSEVSSVAYSADGQSILGAGTEDGVRVWRASDGSLLRTVRPWIAQGREGYDATIMRLSPDGSLMAGASWTRSDPDWYVIDVWRTDDESQVATMRARRSFLVSDLAISPDGASLAIGGQEGWYVFRIADGTLVHTLPPPEAGGRAIPTYGAAFSADGQTIATSGANGSVRVWRAGEGTLLHTLLEGVSQSRLGPNPLAISADGQLVALGSGSSRDARARIWRTSDGALVHTLVDLSAEITMLAFSPDAELLASSYAGGTSRLWRVADGQPAATLSQPFPVVQRVAFSPDGQTVALSLEDGSARLVRLSDESTLHELAGVNGDAPVVAFSPDGRTLIVGSRDLQARLWRPGDGGPAQMLGGHDRAVLGVAFSPDGQLAASASSDGTVKLWRSADGTEVHTLRGSGQPLVGVAFSSEGQLIAAAPYVALGGDPAIPLWSTADGSSLRMLAASPGMDFLAFSADGQILVTDARFGGVAFVRVADGARLTLSAAAARELGGRPAFSPDGRLLATVGGGQAPVQFRAIR